jgi:hypothetical protein
MLKNSEVGNKCLYCGENLENKWKSEFHVHDHYKTIKCECGKKHYRKVDFDGSGHDNFSLEGKLK